MNVNTTEQKGRKRSLTSLTLQWLSERLRRSEDIKQRVESGDYQLDSGKVAAALANQDVENSP